MAQLIEAMESRVLFTASPGVLLADVSALKSAAVTAKADVAASLKTAASDFKPIKADLKRLTLTPQEKSLLALAQKNETAELTAVKKDVQLIISAGTKDVARLTADVKKLLKAPANATVQAKLASDITLLQSDIAAPEAQLIADVGTVIGNTQGDLSALAAQHPEDAQFQADVSTAQTDLTNSTNLEANDGVTLQSLVNTLVTDLG